MVKKDKWPLISKLILFIAASVAIVSFALICIIAVQKLTAKKSADKNKSDSGSNDYTYMEYDGVKYKYNTGMINILFLGVDSNSDIENLEPTVSNTGSNGKADSIYLLSMDRRNKTVQIMALSRDTMTDIKVTDATGKVVGWGKNHLALGYAYGDGKDKSCQLMSDAVSRLLNNIPIIYYCAANINSLPAIMDVVDNVEVIVPNDDLAGFGDGYQKGQKLTIDADNVERFVRYRVTTQDNSNEGRMERQKVFMEAYMAKFRQIALNEDTINKTTKMLSTLVTNVTVGELSDFIDLYAQSSFDIDKDYHKPAGKNVVGTAHDEFYVDEQALKQMILEMFYYEASSSS
ncbi:MAG: LCP family protein [Lachnospira sp.]